MKNLSKKSILILIGCLVIFISFFFNYIEVIGTSKPGEFCCLVLISGLKGVFWHMMHGFSYPKNIFSFLPALVFLSPILISYLYLKKLKPEKTLSRIIQVYGILILAPPSLEFSLFNLGSEYGLYSEYCCQMRVIGMGLVLQIIGGLILLITSFLKEVKK